MYTLNACSMLRFSNFLEKSFVYILLSLIDSMITKKECALSLSVQVIKVVASCHTLINK